MEDKKEKNIIPTMISAWMIIVSVSEIIFKSEKFYYPVFVGLLLFYFLKLDKKCIRADYSLCMIFFAIWVIISGFISPTDGAIIGVFNKLAVLIFLVLQLQFDYTKDDYRLIRSAFIIQSIILLLIIYFYGRVFWDGRIWVERGDVLTDPNSLVVWTLIPLCLLFETVFATKTKPIFKVGAFILIGLLGRVVLMCGSRAGIVSAVIAIFCCVLYGLKSNIKKRPFLALLFLFVVVGIGLLIYQNIPDNVVARFNYANTSDLGGRTTKWITLLDLLKQSPFHLLFGYGEGGTMYYTSKVAHNLYLEIFFNQGFIGFGLLAIYMYFAFNSVLRKNFYMTFAFIAIAIMSASLSEFNSRGVMFAFFLAGAKWHLNEKEYVKDNLVSD